VRVFRRSCKGCGEEFTAKSPQAVWCSQGCKKRVQRGADVPPPQAAHEPEAPTGLVSAVTLELGRAGATKTFAGQLAIELAKRLSQPDESGISSLSKELRTVMASAIEGTTPPADDEDDEVAMAREARERKARQAAGRA
jgi:hypothetical protein